MSDNMTPARARQLTMALLSEYGLTGWSVAFNNARRAAGTCDHRRRVITLSRYLMAQRSYEDTKMTITHEIAHALTPGHGHDAVWARKHRELGGNGRRCFQHTDDKAPWIGECPHGKTFTRYRQPQHMNGYRCRCPRSGPVTWRRNAA